MLLLINLLLGALVLIVAWFVGLALFAYSNNNAKDWEARFKKQQEAMEKDRQASRGEKERKR